MRDSSKKRILVTGGAGFLGSHLCERLISDHHDVICLDNCYTGSKENIYHLLGHSSFEFLRHDITFPLSTLRSTRSTILRAGIANPLPV